MAYVKSIGRNREIPVLVCGKFSANQFTGRVLGMYGDAKTGSILVTKKELRPQKRLFEIGTEIKFSQDDAEFFPGVVTGYVNSLNGQLGYLVQSWSHEGAVLRNEVSLRSAFD